MGEEDDWEMSEPKDGFTEEEERIVYKMMQNMPVEDLKKIIKNNKAKKV